MAFTQLDLDKLEKAIASGKKEVRINGRTMVWQNAKDLLSIRRMIKAEVDAATASALGIKKKAPFKTYRFRTTKSW